MQVEDDPGQDDEDSERETHRAVAGMQAVIYLYIYIYLSASGRPGTRSIILFLCKQSAD